MYDYFIHLRQVLEINRKYFVGSDIFEKIEYLFLTTLAWHFSNIDTVTFEQFLGH